MNPRENSARMEKLYRKLLNRAKKRKDLKNTFKRARRKAKKNQGRNSVDTWMRQNSVNYYLIIFFFLNFL